MAGLSPLEVTGSQRVSTSHGTAWYYPTEYKSGCMELKTASKEFLTFPNIPHMAKKTEPAKAGKIKIKKSDIEAGNLELPEGYSLKKVKTKTEMISDINKEISSHSEAIKISPNFKELVSYNAAGIVHPYYESMARVNELLGIKINLQK